jgi:uncharacterized protein with von Willebrand factor type A (vWA) domain
MADLGWSERLIRFGRALRREGMPVGTGRIVDFCEAASLVEPSDLYWVGRATLVGRRDEIPVYDRTFCAYFAGDSSTMTFAAPQGVERAAADEGREIETGRGRELNPGSLRASRLELLRHKSFGRMTDEELRELADLMTSVSVAVPLRRSLRTRSAKRGQADIRRTIRRAYRTGGDPVHRAWKERRSKRRRLVLITDISGSMAPYSRGLLIFAHAALRTHRDWEAFCFGTKLTRITRTLAGADPADALARAADHVFDWDGGTRIGESMKDFLDNYGHGGMARGAVVVICSDGFECGDPAQLGEQMQRLRRLAYRTVWLNPLKEHPGYQPLAGGMRNALPHVDTFASGHSVADLDALAARLAAL